jgi:hypothetical protein
VTTAKPAPKSTSTSTKKKCGTFIPCK